MKSRGSRFIRIGIAFIAIALLLTAYNIIAGIIAGNHASDVLDQFEISEDDGILDPDMEMPTIEIDGVRYVGIIEIPSVAIKLPVASEWSYGNLNISPCRYSGTAYKNNMVIAAHNYRNHFGRLSGVSIDDSVVFTDVEGRRFEYKVSDIEVRDPYDIEGMTESEWDLTLFTCTLGGRTRLTVRCAYIGGPRVTY